MAQFWQCCKRTGLPEKDALALLGFHPFARSWAEPQAAEQRSAADQPRFSNAFFRSVGVSDAHTASTQSVTWPANLSTTHTKVHMQQYHKIQG